MLVIGIAFTAACMDLATEKIANNGILAFALIGIGYQLSTSGVTGLCRYLSGAAIPLLMLFILFVFRMLGPGDIKLLSVLGGIMGAAAIVRCIVISFLFGAALSAAFIVACGNLQQRLRYFADYVSHFIHTKEIRPYYKSGAQIENIHFSIPIFMSVMLYAGGFY